jgi:hypothetical protein
VTQLRITGPDGMKPLEVDGRIARIIMAVLAKRRDILAPRFCSVQFDCGEQDHVKMRVSAQWAESELETWG